MIATGMTRHVPFRQHQAVTTPSMLWTVVAANPADDNPTPQQTTTGAHQGGHYFSLLLVWRWCRGLIEPAASVKRNHCVDC